MTDWEYFLKYGRKDKELVGSLWGGCLGIIVLTLLFLFIQPIPVMIAWNMIAVGMFGLPVLTYWPAFWGTLAIGTLFCSPRFGDGGK